MDIDRRTLDRKSCNKKWNKVSLGRSSSEARPELSTLNHFNRITYAARMNIILILPFVQSIKINISREIILPKFL